MIDSEKLQLLAQLVESMRDAAEKLQYYYEQKDSGNLKRAKQEVLNFQKQIDEQLQ